MDELAGGFRRGEPDAVRELYRRFAGPVGTVARSIVRDRELAAEVVQQTFLKAWQAAATFEVERELAPWLYAIARRTAIDVLRHERRGTIGDHEPERDAIVDAPSFERTWEVFEVRRAIDDLPAAERDVIRLSHLAGLTHREIAERLAVPLGTVKSRIARAQTRLVAALAHLDVANRDVTGAVEERERR